MPIFQDYFNNLQSIDPEREMELQLEAFYHDAQGGLVLSHSFCKGKKSGKETYARAFTDEYQTSCYPVKENVDSYTALCTFTGKKKDRRSATNRNGFNRGVFYIDIDFHKVEAALMEQSVCRACEILSEAYENGTLPIPTLINYTGRGLAIYYIMDRFLALKTPNTEKSHWKFKSVYNNLWERYRQLLEASDCLGVEVDGNVRNTARLVRVAGTYNTAVGKKCHLVWRNCDEAGNTVYVKNFSDLVMEQPLQSSVITCTKEDQDTLPKTRRLASGKHSSSAARPQSMTLAMKHRVEAMKALAVLRAENGMEGCRHAIALIAYNAAFVCDHERAYDVLCEVNACFTCPLSRSELMQIVNTSRRVGGYRFTTKTVRESTCMTAEEEAQIQLRKPLSITKRKRESMERQQKKEEVRLQVAKEILHNPGLTYAEIGELFSMSENTVKRIAKDYHVTRRGKKNRMTDAKLESVKEEKVSKFTSSIGVVYAEGGREVQEKGVSDAVRRPEVIPASRQGESTPVQAASGHRKPSGISDQTACKPCRRRVKPRKGKPPAPADIWMGEGLSMVELFVRHENDSWARQLRAEGSYVYQFY